MGQLVVLALVGLDEAFEPVVEGLDVFQRAGQHGAVQPGPDLVAQLEAGQAPLELAAAQVEVAQVLLQVGEQGGDA